MDREARAAQAIAQARESRKGLFRGVPDLVSDEALLHDYMPHRMWSVFVDGWLTPIHRVIQVAWDEGWVRVRDGLSRQGPSHVAVVTIMMSHDGLEPVGLLFVGDVIAQWAYAVRHLRVQDHVFRALLPRNMHYGTGFLVPIAFRPAPEGWEDRVGVQALCDTVADTWNRLSSDVGGLSHGAQWVSRILIPSE